MVSFYGNELIPKVRICQKSIYKGFALNRSISSSCNPCLPAAGSLLCLTGHFEGLEAAFWWYRPVEMWWHTHRNQISSFARNGPSPFKSAGGRQSSRLLAAEVCGISGSNAGYTMFRGSVKGTGYPLHSPVHLNLPVGISSVDCWQPRCAHQR